MKTVLLIRDMAAMVTLNLKLSLTSYITCVIAMRKTVGYECHELLHGSTSIFTVKEELDHMWSVSATLR